MPIEYRKNPSTGAMAPFDTGSGTFVGSAPTAPVSLFPPKPAQEVTTVRPIVSAMGTEAIKQKELAAGEQMAAQENLGGVEKTIAERTAPIAQEKVGFLEQQQADAEARRLAREAEKARHLLGRDEQIKSEADAQVKAGNAKEDLLGDGWGAFLAALLTGIGTAAHLFQGGSGPSPAERVLDKRIGAHKEKLMAKWEAEKATRELKDRDHAAYLEAQSAREDEISKDVQRQLQVYEARVQSVAAKMQPEKQQALTRLATAETAKIAAKEKEQDSQRFDAKQSVTTRTEALGAGPNGKLPAPGKEEIDMLANLRTDRERLKQLKGLILQSGENARDFRAVQKARREFETGERRKGSLEKITGIGPGLSTIAQGPPFNAFPPSVDRYIDQQKNPGAVKLHQALEDYNTIVARSYGGVINEGDRTASAAAGSLGTIHPNQFIEAIDAKLQSMEEKEKLLVGSKRFPTDGAGAP